MDDILCISNNINFLTSEKNLLWKEFEVVDDGEVHYILGMSIKRDREKGTLLIRQPKYTEDILKRFGRENCNSVSTPLEPGKRFQNSQDDDELCNTTVYQQAIGCLTYLSTARRRPDIAIAVSMLSRFMSKPGKETLEWCKTNFLILEGNRELWSNILCWWKKFVTDWIFRCWLGRRSRYTPFNFRVYFKIGNSTICWCSKSRSQWQNPQQRLNVSR